MKKIFILMMGLIMGLSAYAQDEVTTVTDHGFFDNTYVGLTAGATGYVHPKQYGFSAFGHSVQPTATLRVGKWLTPVVGAEIEGQAAFNTGGCNSVLFQKTFVDATYVGANAVLNLNNLFHGYRGTPDTWEFMPTAGIGWMHAYGVDGVTEKASNQLAAKYAFKVAYNFGKKKAWQAVLTPTYTFVLTPANYAPKFDSRRSAVGLELGIVYKFKNKSGRHNFRNAYLLNETLFNGMKKELEICKNRKPEVRIVPKEVIKEVTTTKQVFPAVQFTKGSAEVDTAHAYTLDKIAEYIKANTDKTFTLTGYASEEGTDEFNQNLSVARAEAVAQQLTNRGVNADQLKTVGKGETTQFGDKLEYNRIVITEE